ncbi:acyltransferase family protein [Staphylococcus borealis]|uniref:acyltransferase family protein n=1 Tax=Staphylococcus borealis TaxID=2742203 RepID=UPI0012E155BA|nr:acyltransferase family protein [Staphylococcus borealis]MUN94265.1 acyltransferase family protein [Staphylococcus borealis]NUI83671.1 acyltransferase family protein [Staphylococcus borealis]
MRVYTSIIFWMRTIACLSVVMIHTITTTFYKFDMPNEGYLLRIFQLLLLYATPMFVFISEFLLAKQYKTKVKDGFFKQKLLTLGIPYIIINLGLAYVYGHPKNFGDYMDSVVFMMFRGGTLTYFIVIIFQFYLLHVLFAKYLVKLNPIKLIIYSLIITSLFWAMRNFIPAPESIYFNWLWQREGWMIFVGWLSYFLLGFYMGYHYEKLMSNIQKYTVHIVSGTIIVTIFVIFNYLFGILTLVDSKRFDTPIYVTFVILLFFLIASYFKYVPRFIIFISNYSFSIYLIHYFFVHRLGALHDHPLLNILFTFTLTVTFSICIAYVMNLSKFGKFIVGGIGKMKYETYYQSYKQNLVD